MPTLISQLSPAAAKLYLALHLYPNPPADPPIAHISLRTLSIDTNMSERTCTYALRELRDLQLITRLPRRCNSPCRYEVHPFPNPQPTATTLPSNSHPAATTPPFNSHPVATSPATNSHPAASAKPEIPIPAPKTHNSHPVATNSTLSSHEEALLSNPTLLKLLASTLSPDQSAELLAIAHRTLARLGPEDPA